MPALRFHRRHRPISSESSSLLSLRSPALRAGFFHSLIPLRQHSKVIARETDVEWSLRLVWRSSPSSRAHGADRSRVLDRASLFRHQHAAAWVGAYPSTATATITAWGFPVMRRRCRNCSQDGRATLFGAPAGPSLAVGRRAFRHRFWPGPVSLGTHLAIMSGDLHLRPRAPARRPFISRIVRSNWGRSADVRGSLGAISSVLVSPPGATSFSSRDRPNGGLNILVAVFSSHHMLAALALAVVTAIFVSHGRLRQAWVRDYRSPGLVIGTSTAALQKILQRRREDRLLRGGLSRRKLLLASSADRAAVAPQLIFNQQLDGWLTVFFLLIVWVVVLDMLLRCRQHLSGRDAIPSTESPYVATQLT